MIDGVVVVVLKGNREEGKNREEVKKEDQRVVYRSLIHVDMYTHVTYVYPCSAIFYTCRIYKYIIFVYRY